MKVTVTYTNKDGNVKPLVWEEYWKDYDAKVKAESEQRLAEIKKQLRKEMGLEKEE